MQGCRLPVHDRDSTRSQGLDPGVEGMGVKVLKPAFPPPQAIPTAGGWLAYAESEGHLELGAGAS